MKLISLLFFGIAVLSNAQETPAKNKQANPDLVNSAKIIIHNEDGTEEEADIVSQELVGKRKIFPYKDESAVSFDELSFLNGSGEFVTPKLDRVVLIQYWSIKGLKVDSVWNSFIEEQKKYKDNDRITFMSVFFDLSNNSKETYSKTVAWLKQQERSIPKNLFFDYNDSFRSTFKVYGGNSYYIIDNRRQLTYSSRGDFEEVHYVFDEIENALKNLEKDGYLPKRRSEFSEGEKK